MGLASVLVDEARIWRKLSSGEKIEGRTTFGDAEPGTWFAARLMLPQAEPESAAPPNPFAYKRVVRVPTLICDLFDFENGDVVIVNSDILEVKSDELGHDMWQVTSAAHAFRKKRSIIAYQVTLKRVEVTEFAER